jgi:hypothetical protein
VALGSPLSVRVELTNTGMQPVEIMPSLDPAAGFLLFHLVTPDGTSNRFTVIRWETKDMLIKPRSLAPGAQLTFETFLYGKLEEQRLQQNYLFAAPGKYELFAEYVVEQLGIRIRSGLVPVSVGSPVAGWDRLKQEGIVELMEGRIRSRQAVSNRVARVESIIASQPAHPLRPWVESKNPGSSHGGR